MHLAIFDDNNPNLEPLTLTKGVFELRLGSSSLLKHLLNSFPHNSFSLHVKDYMVDLMEEKYKVKVNELEEGKILLVNGSLFPPMLLKKVKIKERKFYLTNNDKLILALASRDEVEKFLKSKRTEVFKGEKLNLEGKFLIEYLWDIINFNEKKEIYILEKSSKVKGLKVLGKKKNLKLLNTKVEPFVILDTQEGNIIIEEAHVEAFSIIRGPCYIGKGTIIRGAKVNPFTSIGEESRVGCEIGNSIIHSFSNVAHEGYIGHSYLGEWVNVGAGTIISDLKNTYGEIKVKGLNSNRVKLGAFIGDNVKISIGTKIFCGKTVGVCSHLYGYVTEDVPSFTIYFNVNGKKMVEMDLDSAIEIQRRMMERRKIVQKKEDKKLLEEVYHITKYQREKLGIKKEKFSL